MAPELFIAIASRMRTREGVPMRGNEMGGNVHGAPGVKAPSYTIRREEWSAPMRQTQRYAFVAVAARSSYTCLGQTIQPTLRYICPRINARQRSTFCSTRSAFFLPQNPRVMFHWSDQR